MLRVRVFLRWGFSEAYAQSSQASLWARRSSFRYLQLLSAETAARDGSCEESLREDSGGSAATAFVPLNRICGDAGARAFADQRGWQEEPVEDFAGTETKGSAGVAEKTKSNEQHTIVVTFRWERDGKGAFLAATIL